MGIERTTRTIGIGAALAATLLVSACGAGATTATTPVAPTTAAAPATGGGAAAVPAPAPVAGTAAAGAGAAQLTGPTTPPAGFPAREPYVEKEGGNDGPMAKIQQGMPKAQAVAAGLGTDGAPVVTVTGTDTDCFANTATVAPGPTWFVLENRGQLINELYLVKDGEDLIEVENLENGQAGAFKYTVAADGQWIVACEPGQADKQVRFPLTVTG